MINMRTAQICVLLSIVLPLSSCAENTANVSGILENIKNAESVTLNSRPSSIKRRTDISYDNSLCGFKTETWNTEFSQPEYTVYTADTETELFSLRPADPGGISGRSFDMYALYEGAEPVGYIQSDVFRGNESYIIYDKNGRYAFCDIEKIRRDKGTVFGEFKIISFDDELLYTLDVSQNASSPGDDEAYTNMRLDRMRPDAQTDISAVALAFIIDTEYHTEYLKRKDEENKCKK
ncbi:MAG: hypothetical protein J1F64_01710 [Oscillospiraceae bacterium]|nr:hypothetical protein [Oscillospiraceae bacterium]